mmetsp:Transcript_44880/g.116288  ORF Transcript_44880/g.116288 Transcript_44880/m.116288 type:complete len:371 (+) Transcript_44880:78-1190(+)
MTQAHRGTFLSRARLLQEPAELAKHVPRGATDLAVKRVARATLAAKSEEQRSAARKAPPLTLMDLSHGPFFDVVAFLDAAALTRADAACRQTRDLNRSHRGPWCVLGQRVYVGLELDGESVFYPSAAAASADSGASCAAARRLMRIDWKCRFARFGCEARNFRAPFGGVQIARVDQADDIAYWRCKLRSDILGSKSAPGVYMEVEVSQNPDNVSLAVVDFEAGGCSSITFSPDTGAVIRERKVRESPRKVEGTYIQPLPTITSGQGFRGSMGLYLKGGHLAFFRRHVVVGADRKATEVGEWETTGFVTDLSWAEGQRLSPCLAFRDTGDYQIHMACLNAQPPVVPSAYADAQWRSLDWDAGEQEDMLEED